MKDARANAFSIIKGRLERARGTLRDTLAAQQNEREEAHAQVLAQQDSVADAAALVERRTARIDGLLDGRRAVRIEELLDWQASLADALAQRTRELDTLQRLRDAEASLEQKIAATRHAIMRHDVRIELCVSRMDALRRAAQALADDAQDEESEEAFVGRRIARAAAQRQASGGGSGAAQ